MTCEQQCENVANLEDWIGNFNAYFYMQMGTIILRTISTVFFCHALYQIWQGLKGYNYTNEGQKQSNCILVLHLVFLIIYISLDVTSVISMTKHNQEAQKNFYFGISWILWSVSGTANFILMIIVVESLNSSFQEMLLYADFDLEESEQVQQKALDQDPVATEDDLLKPPSRPTSSGGNRQSAHSSAHSQLLPPE